MTTNNLQIETKQVSSVVNSVLNWRLNFKEKVEAKYTPTADNEITKEYVRSLVIKHSDLTPLELNALYPNISTPTFNAHHYWVNFEFHKANRVNKRIAEIHTLASKKNNSYEDKNHIEKENNRIEMAKMVNESGVYGLIPSLSHIDCLVERKLQRLTDKNTFLNIDRNELIVEGAHLTMQKYNLKGNVVCGDMLDVFKKYNENDFAHIFMDFCGSLPIEGVVLDYAIKNNLVVINGYIFLTICNAVRKVVNGFAREYNAFASLHTSDMKCSKTEFANKMLLRYLIGDKFEIVLEKSYQTDSPMLFCVIKRVK
jgi:hypothetical protein